MGIPRDERKLCWADFAQGRTWATRDLGGDSLMDPVHSFLNLEHFVWQRLLFCWWALTNWLLDQHHGSKLQESLWKARPHFSQGQPTGDWRSFQSINSNERKPQLCCKVDSDQRLTHSTHDRKLNFYTYLVLDSIKTKTERQGQLRHHVLWRG